MLRKDPSIDAVTTQLHNVTLKKSFTLPLTPASRSRLLLISSATLQHFKHLLTPYEQDEISSFQDIYFAGAAHIHKILSKSRPTGADLQECNIGRNETDGQVYNHGILKILFQLQVSMMRVVTIISQNTIISDIAMKFYPCSEKDPLVKWLNATIIKIRFMLL